MNAAPFPAFVPHAVNHHRGWFAVLGFALIVLGLLCFIFTGIATLLTAVAIGIVTLLGGIALVVSAFWATGLWHAVTRALVGLVFIVAGWWLFTRPVLGALALTAVIGWFFIVSGAIRLIEAVVAHRHGWGWAILNAAVTLLLGILLLANWPFSGLFAIGLFLGIDLLFDGVIILMATLASGPQRAPAAVPPPQPLPPQPVR